MTTFNTGNPIGSVDPRDLYDNAENLDTAVNTKTDTTWTDRLGVERKTFHGMETQFDNQQVGFEDRFQETLSKIGYEQLGDYAAGLEITKYNQIFRHEGEWWHAAATTELPYTTTGDWSTEGGLFMGVGEALLRQDLADPDKGAAMIGFSPDADYSEASAGGAITRRVKSISNLRAISGRFDGDSILLVGYYEDTPGYGAGMFVWDSESVLDDNGGTIIAPTGSPSGRFIRVLDGALLPEQFGADSTGSSDATLPFLNCLTEALGTGMPVHADNDYLLNGMDLSLVPGSLEIRINGTITRASGSTDADLISFGANKTSVKIHGQGTIDFNQEGQIQWNHGITCAGSTHFNCDGLTFRNVKSSALYMQSREMNIVVTNCKFIDGALHTGVLNTGSCIFLRTRGAKHCLVRNCEFIQTADPLPNQARQPAGFIHIDTGATTFGNSFEVTGCYFENLGHHAAGNLVMPLDFYSYADSIVIKNNKFRKSRITPIRTSGGRSIIIKGNEVQQTNPQIIDGGAPYTDASMISVGLVDRGYVTDTADIYNVTISDNSLRCSEVQCHGIRLSGENSNARFRNATVSGNMIWSLGGNPNGFGLFVNTVQKVTIRDCQILNFNYAVRAQQTSVAPLITEGATMLSVSDCRIMGGSTGIYARTSVSNLNVVLDGLTIIGASTHSFSLRDLNNATVKSCSLGGNSGDVSNLSGFWYEGNDPGSASQPAGYLTASYYRLLNNKGLGDALST